MSNQFVADFPLKVASQMQNCDLIAVRFCDIWPSGWNHVIRIGFYTSAAASCCKFGLQPNVAQRTNIQLLTCLNMV